MTTATVTNTSSELRRAWHVVATVEEIGDRPHQVWLLGQAWALVRLGGQLVAFVDRCPHRLAPLSIGTIVGDELQCGYHGWRFDVAGHCTAIPALGDSDRIPRRANPVNRGGSASATAWGGWPRRTGVRHPDVSRVGGQQSRPNLTTVVRTTAGAVQLVDNFLDASYFTFVHTQTFGDDKAAQVVDDGITRAGWTVAATGHHAAVQPQELLKRGSASLSVYLHLYFPVTDATFAILFSCQPETATSTRIYKLMARNDLNGNLDRIAATIKDEDLVLEEDLAVLERFLDTDLPLDQRVEAHPKADRLSISWRRLLAEWLDSPPSHQSDLHDEESSVR